jgi:hypothetical protein
MFLWVFESGESWCKKVVWRKGKGKKEHEQRKRKLLSGCGGGDNDFGNNKDVFVPVFAKTGIRNRI